VAIAVAHTATQQHSGADTARRNVGSAIIRKPSIGVHRCSPAAAMHTVVRAPAPSISDLIDFAVTQYVLSSPKIGGVHKFAAAANRDLAEVRRCPPFGTQLLTWLLN
jgi:hypothetical protein